MRGRLDESWSKWRGGMSVAVESANDGVRITVLGGSVVDKPAWHLEQAWDMNLDPISVNRIMADSS